VETEPKKEKEKGPSFIDPGGEKTILPDTEKIDSVKAEEEKTAELKYYLKIKKKSD
jgi:hypothetical protein